MSKMEANNRNRPAKAHRSRMEPSIESQPVNRDSRGPEPLSPVSSDSAEGKGSDMEFRCFFAVTDPESTLKLKGTKHSACLGTFPSVNRLKEHIWRAHSPTHNCPHCRAKITSKSEEFKKKHALCRSGCTKITRPLPPLMSAEQADGLERLNQHYKKPNDETIRCGKLWNALFPAQKFELARVMGSPKPAGTGDSESRPVRESTLSSSRQKGQRQPKTPTSIHWPQNATPPTSPTSTKRPVINSAADVRPKFSVVTHPKGDNFSTKPRTRSGASKDSGLGTEPSSYDDITPPDAGELGARGRQSSPGERDRRKSSSGTLLAGMGFPHDGNISTKYPRRVLDLEAGDSDMSDDSTMAMEVGLAVQPNLNPRRCSPASSVTYDSRSDYSGGARSQSDVEMGSEQEDDSEEEDSDGERDDEESIDGDDSDLEMGIDNPDAVLEALGQRVFSAAAHGRSYDIFDPSSESDSY